MIKAKSTHINILKNGLGAVGMLVISATQKSKARRSHIRGQPGQDAVSKILKTTKKLCIRWIIALR